MSLAWQGVALTLLIVPGIFVFLGLYAPEQFSRDVSGNTALTELALVLVAALGVHAFGVLLVGCACAAASVVPCIDLNLLLGPLVTTGAAQQAAEVHLLRAVVDSIGWNAAYYVALCVLGLAAGAVVGKFITRDTLHVTRLLAHPWVYELTTGVTYAYVLTRCAEGGRSLIYSGRLGPFRLLRDGSFAYLVLNECKRSYLVMDDESARTTDPVLIGANSRGADEARDMWERDGSLFIIYGDQIVNVVFEQFPLQFSGVVEEPNE
jgi:hypothetical protein